MVNGTLGSLAGFGFRPVDQQDFAAIERLAGCALPVEVRSFLEQTSGSTPAKAEFRYGKSCNGASLIQFFYAVTGTARDDDLLLNALKVLKGRIPLKTLPIAEDPGGNVVLVYLEGDRRGEVWYWDHEQEGGPSTPDANLHFIASSLSAFLASLCICA